MHKGLRHAHVQIHNHKHKLYSIWYNIYYIAYTPANYNIIIKTKYHMENMMKDNHGLLNYLYTYSLVLYTQSLYLSLYTLSISTHTDTHTHTHTHTHTVSLSLDYISGSLAIADGIFVFCLQC